MKVYDNQYFLVLSMMNTMHMTFDLHINTYGDAIRKKIKQIQQRIPQ